MPHLNYGLLLWRVNLKDIFLLQKKVIRLLTNKTYKNACIRTCTYLIVGYVSGLTQQTLKKYFKSMCPMFVLSFTRCRDSQSQHGKI